MTFIYYDNLGQIKMQSETLNETELNVREVEEIVEVDPDKTAYYEDNKIVYKETPDGQKKAEMMKEIGKAKNVEDLKLIINKLL